jgi:hypothetical protein
MLLKDIIMKDIETYTTLGEDMYHIGYPVQIKQNAFPGGPISKIYVDIEIGEIPKENLEKTVILSDFITWPRNFGHVLGDMIIPAFRLADLYDLVSRDLLILLGYRGDMKKWKIPEDNYEVLIDKISYLLTDRKLTQLSNYGNTNSDLVCMENLLVGGSHYSMLGGADTDGGWDKFIINTMNFFNLDSNIFPKAQKVLVVIKDFPKRSLLDPREIADNITRDFGVEAIAVMLSNLTLEEQIRLISNCTLVISGCGGVSFSIPFLPPNGVALIMSYYQPDGRPDRMEGYIFDRFSRYLNIHYMIIYAIYIYYI